jgi:hypothetical protein
MAPNTERAPVVAESTGKPHRKSALDINKAKYLSESAFARHTGMGRTTVWRLRKSGRLRFIRINPRLIRIPVSEITRLGREHAVEQKIQITTNEDEEPP